MKDNHLHQKLAVDSGHWPLFRYDPRRAEQHENPLKLDSKAPSIPYAEFALSETRFNSLLKAHPKEAQAFLVKAQHEVSERYKRYQQMADMDREEAPVPSASPGASDQEPHTPQAASTESPVSE